MDQYTKKTKIWLEQRFSAVDESGIYIAHQPIYGFHGFHCEPALIEKYIRTYQIMKTLAQLEFGSFLDAGGAEGYRAGLVKRFFGVQSRNCDLSEEACKRARDIFGIDSDAADLHNLPYRDGSFDVVLCSESIEHLPDFKAGVRELLRVARNALIVTVPHESQESVAHSVDQHLPHGHLHSFDLASFDFLKHEGYSVSSRRIVSPHLSLLASLLPIKKIEQGSRFPETIYRVYNAAVPLLKKLQSNWAAAALIQLDEKLCAISSRYNAALFVILKEPSASLKENKKQISAKQIVEFRVPYHEIGHRR